MEPDYGRRLPPHGHDPDVQRRAQGVVDANCRVHGLENLYVAGSSVYPTGSNINPTLTLVALALRLSDHLKHRITERA